MGTRISQKKEKQDKNTTVTQFFSIKSFCLKLTSRLLSLGTERALQPPPSPSYPAFVRHVLPRKHLLQCCVESECAGYHIKSLIREDINMFIDAIVGIPGLRFHTVTRAPPRSPPKSLIAAAFPLLQ